MSDDDFMQRYLKQFISEAEEIIGNLETFLLSLEKEKDAETIHSVFRNIHTLKGNSLMCGFNNIGSFLHSLETLLDKVRGGDIELSADILNLLFNSLDKTKEVIFDLDNESTFQPQEYIEKVNQYLEKKKDSIDEQPPEQEYQSLKAVDIYPQLEKYIEIARDENYYLTHIILTYNADAKIKLGDIISLISENKESILEQQILYQQIETIESLQNFDLNHSFLILSKEKMTMSKFTDLARITETEHLYTPVVKETAKKQTMQEKQNAASSYLKVDNELLDIINNLSSETIIARNQLVESLALEEDTEEEIRLTRLSNLITSLHNQIKKVRLQQLETTFPRISRVARDASQKLNKKVNLHFNGGDVELDKTIINSISESINHIIKNSIDHGIEETEERLQLGKPENGNLYISAFLRNGNIQIQIKDDGKGLSIEKIKNKVLKQELVDEQELAIMSDKEIEKLIFLPGFSTVEQVSQISGRGVGMDVVQSSFKRLGGAVNLDNKEGEGLSIIVSIPQNVTVFSSLIISVAGQKYAIYQKNVMELIRLNPDDYYQSGEYQLYKLRNSIIPLVSLTKLLYNQPEEQLANYIAVIQADDLIYGILFDELIGIEEVVIKALGEFFKKLNLYDGITILGDGKSILVLNVFGISEVANVKYSNESFINNETEDLEDSDFSQFIFRSEKQQYAISPNVIFTVIKMFPEDVQNIGTNPVIKFKKKIIPLIKIERFFLFEQSTEINQEESIYALIIIYQEFTFAILANEIIDITQELEVYQSDNELARYSDGYSYVDDKLTIIINSENLFSDMLQYIESYCSEEEGMHQ